MDDSSLESFEFSLLITENESPELQILVFYIVKNEIIPDRINVKIQKCVKNKVYLSQFYV